MTHKTITILQEEYEFLLKRDIELTLLENAGVDNWNFYGEHREVIKRDFPDMEYDEAINAIVENMVIIALGMENELY
jgi:hypothetical protein